MNKHLVVVKDTMDGKSVSIFLLDFVFLEEEVEEERKYTYFCIRKKNCGEI